MVLDCHLIHCCKISRTRNFTIAIIPVHENILRERCNVYHPSLLPARRHEPHCLYRPTENWQTWTSHSVKDQTFQTIQRVNSEGSLGNHRWSQIERPSRGEPESKQRGNFLHNCFTQNVLSIIKVIFRTSISKTKSVNW